MKQKPTYRDFGLKRTQGQRNFVGDVRVWRKDYHSPLMAKDANNTAQRTKVTVLDTGSCIEIIMTIADFVTEAVLDLFVGRQVHPDLSRRRV